MAEICNTRCSGCFISAIYFIVWFSSSQMLGVSFFKLGVFVTVGEVTQRRYFGVCARLCRLAVIPAESYHRVY